MVVTSSERYWQLKKAFEVKPSEEYIFFNKVERQNSFVGKL